MQLKTVSSPKQVTKRSWTLISMTHRVSSFIIVRFGWLWAALKSKTLVVKFIGNLDWTRALTTSSEAYWQTHSSRVSSRHIRQCWLIIRVNLSIRLSKWRFLLLIRTKRRNTLKTAVEVAQAALQIKRIRDWYSWRSKSSFTWKCSYQQMATVRVWRRASRPCRPAFRTSYRSKCGIRLARSRAFIMTLAATATCTCLGSSMRPTMQIQRAGFKSCVHCLTS